MRAKLKFLPILAMVAMTLQPASGLSGDWQPRSAINKEGDERTTKEIVFEKWVDARDQRGVAVTVLPGAVHTLHVEGTYQFQTWAGTARLADALCAKDHYDPAAGPNWQLARWDHLVNVGWLDLKARDGAVARAIDWKPLGTNPTVPVDAGCSSTNHYTASFVPTTNEVSFFIDDAWTDDTAGGLKLTISSPGFERPYQCPKRTEEPIVDKPGDKVGEIEAAHVTVDSRRSTDDYPDPNKAKNADGSWQLDHWNESGHWGIYTCNWALPTSTYRVTVTGTFRYAFTHDLSTRRAMADAECARDTQGGPKWWNEGLYAPTPEADDLLDLYLNHKPVEWKPIHESHSSPGCSDLHMYVLENWSPAEAGPINLKIYDVNYAEFDNVGELHVMIERTGPGATPHSDLYCTLPTA